MRKTKGDIIFTIINSSVMVILSLIMLYPMWYVIVASFTNFQDLLGHSGLLIFPINPTVKAYSIALKNDSILTGYAVTLFVVVTGTFLGVLLTTIGAYFATRHDAKLSKPIFIMIIITMYVNGGMIPMYFNVLQLGMNNSIWSLVIPTMINTYNLILMKATFEGLPKSLIESAQIDGAGHWTILFRIILPIIKATIAVIALYYAVDKWNAWFNAMLFIKDKSKQPLQLVLRNILIASSNEGMALGADEDAGSLSEMLKYSVIVIATLPILCVYPFVQKFFVQGITIGAVKG